MKSKNELDEEDEDVEEDFQQIKIEDLLSELKIHDDNDEDDFEETKDEKPEKHEETKN